jgi:PAS domain S-box-containing protein
MPQKIFTATAAGDVDYFNPQWSEFTGLTFEEIRAWGWTRFIHPEDLPENVRVWRQAIATGEPFQFEHRFRRADGEYRWHLSRALPVRNAAGEVMMWIGANTEVHTIKEAEKALREADRMKDEFLATLSHELRTPLTAITGWSQLLAKGVLSPSDQHVAVEAIRTSAAAQAQLIEDVLDVSRITTGKMRLDRRPADLAEIVEAAVATVRPAAEAKAIPLAVSLPRDLGSHFVDPTRIQQVVWNLLSNAIKFSPAGAPVEVTLRGNRGSSQIEVRDRGPGISSAFLPHIFERFRQADSSATRAHAGLGLGLSLAKELMELHGGTIAVESDEGRGSRFIVSIPAGAKENRNSGPDEDGAVAHGHAAGPLAGFRVLYVDDRDDARLLIAAMLKSAGAEVALAGSAAEALEVLPQARPHVVVTDIAMPERDGYDLLEAMRARPEWRDLPVIALTAHGEADQQQRAAAAGFDDYLRKPIDVHDLTQAVARAAHA